MGSHFVKTTLKEIGLVIHLNHGSLRCPTPNACGRTTTNRSHHRRSRSSSELLWMQSGDTSIHAASSTRPIPGNSAKSANMCNVCAPQDVSPFLTYGESCRRTICIDPLSAWTNNTGIQMPRSRYRPAMRCLVQWRHLKALKRGGRRPQYYRRCRNI